MSDFSSEDKTLLKSILIKRASSQVLTDAERKFADKLFNQMMDSKKCVQKVVKVLTGEDIRKAKKEKIANDNPAAQPVDLTPTDGTKLPDADNKPKELYTEEHRLTDMLQVPVLPVTKSLRTGDPVVKLAPSNATLGRIGVVKSVASNTTATVQWFNGTCTLEPFSGLAYDSSRVNKGDWNSVQKSTSILKEQGNLDELIEWAAGKSHTEVVDHLADQEGVDDPDALANWLIHESDTTKSAAVGDLKKDGDIVNADRPIDSNTMASSMYDETTSPFESLANSLTRTVDLARYFKTCQALHADDPEVAEQYRVMLDDLRGVADALLTALAVELSEARDEYEAN